MRSPRVSHSQPWTSVFSIDLDGSNDFVAGDLSCAPAGARTVLCWVKDIVFNTGDTVISLGKSDATSMEIMQWVTSGTNNVRFGRYDTVGGWSLTGSHAFPAGWFALMWTRTAAGVYRWWLAGAEKTGFTRAAALGGTRLVIGARPNGSYAAAERVSHVVVYDEDLSADAARLCSHPAYAYPHPAAIHAYCPGHIADDTASGGQITDWVCAADLAPTNMDASDLVVDAP